jgi:molybdopterin-guanine dinucleotide biosynthesis protein MobB
MRIMEVLGIAGWSGSGKTTMLARLLPVFGARGLAVSTVKQAGRKFDIDQPGKDSFQHRMAGANEVLVVSERRWALMHESQGAPPRLDELLEKMEPVDLVLVEGFRRDPYPKLEVHRAALGRPLIAPEDPHVVAVATDRVLPDLGIPQFSIDDIEAIAGFIIDRLALGPRQRSPQAAQ